MLASFNDNSQKAIRPAGKEAIRRWGVAAGCFLLSAVFTGLLANFAALFVTEVTGALNISRSVMMVNSLFYCLTTVLFLPFVSRLFSRFSLRLLICIGGVLGAAAHLCYSFAQSIVLFYAGGILAGICASMAGVVPINLMLSNWFREKRGVVTGLVFTGSSLSSALLSPVVANIMERWGWRVAYRCISGTMLIMLIPILILCKAAPQNTEPICEAGKDPSDRERMQPVPEGYTRNECYKMPAFWLLALSTFLLTMIISGTQPNLVAFWQESSSVPAAAVRAYSLVLIAGVIGKLLSGMLIDRFSVTKSSLICLAILLGAFSLMIVARGQSGMIFAAVLFGFSTSFQIVFPSCLSQRFFGRKDYAAIIGFITVFQYLGASIGAPVCAMFYDLTTQYKYAWICFSALAALAFLAIIVAGRFSDRLHKATLHEPGAGA